MPLTWHPKLADGASALYERLLGAMARDISCGKLAPGTRLPPQRDLALALGVSLGTVTRAYSEAERRGLLTAHVGRGSFVAGMVADGTASATAPDRPLDLCHNIPPIGPARAAMASLAAAIRADHSFATLLDYSPVFGPDEHRSAAAHWLTQSAHLVSAHAQSVILTTGAQQAMTLAFGAIVKCGETILCEELTYYGARRLSEHMGYRLHGVAMDDEGLCPDALDQAIQQTGARVLYTMPSLQNPTTRTMTAPRRAAIIEVARRRNLWIVEDDVYGYFARDIAGGVPLAAMAPERVFYISGLSKIVAPGLRAGFLVPPMDGAHGEAIARIMRAMSYTGDGFASAIAAHAMRSGLCAQIADQVVSDARLRLEMATHIFGAMIETPPVEASLHIWLPMSELDAERVAGRALRQGVMVTPPSDAPVTGDPTRAGPRGLRLCLGGVADKAVLDRALRLVRDAIDQRDDHRISSSV
jgi:DNA-binding transcriptional MocR family regulator